MNALTPAEKATRILFALGQRDIEGVLAAMTQDVVFEMPYAHQENLATRLLGKTAVRATFAEHFDPVTGLFKEFTFTRVEAHSLAGEDAAVAEYSSEGVLAATGAPYENHYVGIFRFDGDLLTLWREYFDSFVIAATDYSGHAS